MDVNIRCKDNYLRRIGQYLGNSNIYSYTVIAVPVSFQPLPAPAAVVAGTVLVVFVSVPFPSSTAGNDGWELGSDKS